MQTREVEIPELGRTALLREPDTGRTTAALVTLHGAAMPERTQPMFEHLAEVVSPHGIAVLSFDRRTSPDGGDVPLDDQADDARTAMEWLRRELGVPVGLFGFSQGAWAACVAATDAPEVTPLVLVGCSGVSPAEQMRFHTDELLRRSGADTEARKQLRELRLAMEDLLRGTGDRAHAGPLLEAASTQPWFALAYLAPELPPEDARWPDLDFDPAPVIARVGSRTLLIYGADEEAVPVPESRSVWQTQGDRDLTVVELAGCGHVPVVGSAEHLPDPLTVEDFSADYSAALTRFFAS
ncbi:MAG: alpha/beta hydrolase [Lapillicoccus sp.]